jgi:hypothetical protein
MTEIASKTPDKHKNTEKVNITSCFDDARNRIHNEAK